MRPRGPRPAIASPSRPSRCRSSRASRRRAARTTRAGPPPGSRSRRGSGSTRRGPGGTPVPPPGQRTRPIPRCGTQKPLGGEALLLGYAKRDQDAVREEHEPTARADQPRGLRHPALGIAPHTGPVLAEHQVEGGVAPVARPRRRLRPGESSGRTVADTERRLQLCVRDVEAHRSGTQPWPTRPRSSGAAAQLDHVEPAHVAQDPTSRSGTRNSPQVTSEALPGPHGVLVGEGRVQRRSRARGSSRARRGIRQRRPPPGRRAGTPAGERGPGDVEKYEARRARHLPRPE